MFGWLKQEVKIKRKETPDKNRIWYDKRVYRVVAIDSNGFVAHGGISQLHEHKNMTIPIYIDDRFGKFSMKPIVKFTKITPAMFSAVWFMILPEEKRELWEYLRKRQKYEAAQKLREESLKK